MEKLLRTFGWFWDIIVSVINPDHHYLPHKLKYLAPGTREQIAWLNVSGSNAEKFLMDLDDARRRQIEKNTKQFFNINKYSHAEILAHDEYSIAQDQMLAIVLMDLERHAAVIVPEADHVWRMDDIVVLLEPDGEIRRLIVTKMKPGRTYRG